MSAASASPALSADPAPISHPHSRAAMPQTRLPSRALSSRCPRAADPGAVRLCGIHGPLGGAGPGSERGQLLDLRHRVRLPTRRAWCLLGPPFFFFCRGLALQLHLSRTCPAPPACESREREACTLDRCESAFGFRAVPASHETCGVSLEVPSLFPLPRSRQALARQPHPRGLERCSIVCATPRVLPRGGAHAAGHIRF